MRARFGFFLAPSIFQALLGLALLPLATLVLGPEDYGTFAVVASITGLGTAVATTAAGMLLPAHYPVLSAAGRAGLVRALSYCAAALGSMAALAFALGSEALDALGARGVSDRGLALAIGAMLASLPWSIGYLIVILDGRARFYSVVLLTSACASAACLLTGLFVLHMRLDALFLSYLGAAAVLGVGGLAMLRPHFVVAPEQTHGWIGRILKLTAISGVTNVLESAQTVAERALLARFAGAAAVGIYTHAQLYRNAAFGVLKAASNSLWPRSLIEARDPRHTFAVTGRAWESIYVALTLSGIFAAFIGDDVAALLTHGKFREAGPLIPGLVIVLLLQFSGKPQLALLYAKDQGEFLGKLMGGAGLVAIVSLLWSVPQFGAAGVVASLALQQCLYRAGVHWRAAWLAATPFQDGDVFLGVGLVGLAMFGEAWLAPGPWAGFSIAVAVCALVALARLRALRVGIAALSAGGRA